MTYSKKIAKSQEDYCLTNYIEYNALTMPTPTPTTTSSRPSRQARPKLPPLPSNHPSFPRQPKTGVLLVNLGSPQAATTQALRVYLREFLSDRRVIELPRVWWWLILNGIVLRRRPAQSAAAYRRIWRTKNNNASDWGNPNAAPLRYFTIQQAKAVAQDLARRNTQGEFVVGWGMRYGTPSISQQLDMLVGEGQCNRIIVMPLYPQYAASTTATVQDEVARWLLRQRWQPSVRFVAPWHDDPRYISALRDSVLGCFKRVGKPDALLVSFHGIPLRYFKGGDPYHCHCMKTARLLRETLQWSPKKFHVTFQSRFGREEWLQPYTDETIAELARSGVKHLAVIAPGFVSDCLETLDELGNEAREIFLTNGGETFTYIPALNDTPAGVAVLRAVLAENAGGWLQ